jgi:alanine racemase
VLKSDTSWTADKQTTIAIIAIGYGDGYPRHATNTMPVLINDALHLLAGPVSMDMIAVEIGNAKVAPGPWSGRYHQYDNR